MRASVDDGAFIATPPTTTPEGTTAPVDPVVDPLAVRSALSILLAPGELHQLKILPPKDRQAKGAKVKHEVITLDDLDRTVDAIVALGKSNTLYWSLNPIAGITVPVKAADIKRRRWLPIDVDPVRPSDTPATDEEKHNAELVASIIVEDLSGRGWPRPVNLDSGNGVHLLYRIDLANNDGADDLVKRVLKALDKNFSNSAVHIDTGVGSADRGSRIPGTVNRKGPHTLERPHRVTRLADVPDPIQVVPEELLEALAATAPKVEPKAPQHHDDDDPPDEAKVQGALNHLDPDMGRKEWVEIGMALHDWDSSQAGLGMWREWSRQSKTKFVEGECETNWASFTPGKGITIGTLFGMAKGKGWKPKTPTATMDDLPAQDPKPCLANFVRVKKLKKWVTQAASMGEIAANLATLTAGWPKRVEDTLFIPTKDYRPVYLGSSARFMAWVDSKAQVDWTKGARFITQERFFEHMRMNAERFDAIETLPHYPPIPGIYYLHQEVPPPGGKLEALLDFYCPASPLDRELIKAMTLTLFWGGQPGARPVFLVTGPDKDPGRRGRGVGKSILCSILADELAGGSISVNATESIADIKTRLLSTESGRKRVALLDNIKTLKFSWGDLEGLITAPEISGRAMYVGDARRPNTLVWMLTLNAGSLSSDMAERTIQIKVARPKNDPAWEKSLRTFIRLNRWELIADIRALLEKPGAALHDASRQSAWEQDVLTKTRDWESTKAEIKRRQDEMDDDKSEGSIVAQYLSDQLKARGHAPDCETVFIPSLTVAEWLSAVTRKNYATCNATTFLRGLSIPELEKSDRTEARGWIWKGKSSRDVQARKLKDVVPQSSRPWDKKPPDDDRMTTG